MAAPATTERSPEPPPRPPTGPGRVIVIVLALGTVGALIAAAAVVRLRGVSDATAPPGTVTPAPMIDPVDAGFATDMLDHHQQALQMALLALDKATTTPVRALAVRMVTAQQLESGRFVQYLEERGLRPGDPHREVMGWMGPPVPRDRMPGLASPEALLALTNATGSEVDRLFLDLMLRHHEGGLHMAEYEADHGRNEPLRRLAGRMVVMQRREIADMGQLQGGLR